MARQPADVDRELTFKSMKTFTKKNQIWLIPLLIALILSIPMMIWVGLDNSLPHWDMGRHLWTSIEYGRLWYDYSAGRDSLRHLLTAYFYYPPLVYQPAIIFYVLFGATQKVAVMTNLLWLFVAIFGIYQSSVLLWNKRIGLIASILFMASPIIIAMSHQFQIDLPLTAWVALTFYCLLNYAKAPTIKRALWVGIVLGLGMLLKWTFLFFALPLAMAVTTNLLVSKKARIKTIVIQAFFGLVFAVAIAAPWYLTNRVQIKFDFMANGVAAALREGDPVGFTWAAISFYARALCAEYLLLPILLFLLTGIVLSVIKKEYHRKNVLPILMLVLFYIIFTFLPNKDIRYIMPAMPFAVIIAASVIGMIKNYKAASIVVIIILLLNNLTVAFNLTHGRDVDLLGARLLKGSGYTSGAPLAQLCPIEEVVAAIPHDASARLVGNNPAEFNNWALAFYLEKAGRVWAGEGSDTGRSDYWVLRLDRTPVSREALFQYQERARVVENFNCTDKSIVIVMKNAERGSTYLPTY